MRKLALAVFALLVLAGCHGEAGPQGPPGLQGPPGVPGPQGAPGAVLAYGYFFALMPADNPATVTAGAAVQFPQDGAASGIVRASASEFTLPLVGTYEVSWQASITEFGQLVLALDSGMGAVELAHTVAGRATGTSQITNHVVITTTVPNSTVSVRNVSTAVVALTVTPAAGGFQPVSASMVIKQLQ